MSKIYFVNTHISIAHFNTMITLASNNCIIHDLIHRRKDSSGGGGREK